MKPVSQPLDFFERFLQLDPSLPLFGDVNHRPDEFDDVARVV